MTEIPQAARDAAARQHVEYRGWTDPEDEDYAIAEEMLAAAAPHMGRPVYVLAIGHDLTDRDAENIQRAVVAALTPTEGDPR